MISVFGHSGFIGSHFCAKSRFACQKIPRTSRRAKSDEALWLISTTDNYNVLTNPTIDAETNIVRMLQSLHTFPRGGTFNFVSSWFVYGTDRGEESQICDPKGFYSITKRCAEQLLMSYCETHGLSYRIFRLCNVIGPNDRPSAKKNALTHMISLLKRNEPVSLYYGGKCVRNFLHVNDVVRAIDICLTLAPRNSITNIGAPREHLIGELIAIARRTLGSKSEILDIDPPAFHRQVQTRNFFMDTTKLQALGFHPRVTMTEAIEELCRIL